VPKEERSWKCQPTTSPQVGAGLFAGDLEQHPPGHVRDDLVVEVVAGGCLGDPHEGCHGTELPGDQLTGTLPIEVHAGRGKLLQEHVDLVVEPRTPGHVASLPSSRHGARTSERPMAATPAVLSPLSPLAGPLLLRPRSGRPASASAAPAAGSGTPPGTAHAPCPAGAHAAHSRRPASPPASPHRRP
jgi:hypothetical protein